jgi:flagellar hook-basal body complex protein FliE
MNTVSGLHIPQPPAPPALPRVEAPGGQPVTSFKDLLLDGIQEVNSMQQQADDAVRQLMTGDDVDPAVVLTTVQKADMSFRMMMQIRNKLLQAYQEVKDIKI